MLAPRAAGSSSPLLSWPARVLALLSSSPGSARSAAVEIEAGQRMRDVLRNVAQPVVVAVARSVRTPGTMSKSKYHGATLTSFASLTLEPHPLVAFSLRLPSRMADCLRPSASDNEGTPRAPTTLTVSLLAATNQPVADALARPGVDQGPIFDGPQWDECDPPALRDAVGCLRCEVVHSLPLKTVGATAVATELESKGEQGSELFICRVTDAQLGLGTDSLVHYNRVYRAVGPDKQY